MKANAKRWTEDEAKLALHLYFQLPFGQFTQGNKQVIALAEQLGRTPSSIAMKLSNFASLDPEIIKSGRKGLVGASALDREMWEKYAGQFELLVEAATLAEQEASSLPLGEDVLTKARRRKGQGFFRNIVLESYQTRCCVTGIRTPSLLVASHIVPWSEDEGNRLNPRNGLCLSMLHDKAFDRGFITFDNDLRLVVSAELSEDCDFSRAAFDLFVGKPLKAPIRYQPDPAFLEYHRENIFLS